MNHLIRVLSIALALMATSQWSPAHAEDSIQEQVDRQIKPLIEGDKIVGCVVGVLREGKTQFHGYGELARGGGKKPDERTVYEIGSITKAFTGTLLADMHLRGMLDYDDLLQKHLPETITAPSKGGSPIKLVHLASHTSGLPRLPENFAPAKPTDPYADYSPELAYAFLNDHKLRRAPGKAEYSNYGMGLLGQILANRAGKTYEELMLERIAEPLDLNDTRITLDKDQRSRLAPPHNAGLEPNHNWHFQALVGAGGIRSTAHDMLLLAEATLAKDEQPHTKAFQLAFKRRAQSEAGYYTGLGWMIARDKITRWHNGMTGGYSAALFIVPPTRTAVVVLSNTASDVTAACEKIIVSLHGGSPEPAKVRKEVAVDRKILESYVGKYELAPTFIMTVSLEKNDRLAVQATGQGKLPLYAESETKFFCKLVDAQISFEKDSSGAVTRLILHQNGLNQPAKRQE